LAILAVVGVRAMGNVCRHHQQQEMIFDSTVNKRSGSCLKAKLVILLVTTPGRGGTFPYLDFLVNQAKNNAHLLRKASESLSSKPLVSGKNT